MELLKKLQALALLITMIFFVSCDDDERGRGNY